MGVMSLGLEWNNGDVVLLSFDGVYGHFSTSHPNWLYSQLTFFNFLY